MRIPIRKGLPVILGALLLTSCETADQRHANTVPPSEAVAPAIQTEQSAPPPQAQSTPPVPAPDPVDAMIATAEREYAAGEANYKAGHPDLAKQNFDNAFNALTAGPVDVNGNARLEAEFDKIVEGTHGLEVEALKQGDGFTEPNALPAPIDEANEVTFPVDPNLKAQAETELKSTHSDLPLVINDYVAGYINFYSTRGRGVLERALTRAGRYRGMIEQTFKEVGVPQDLIYLAQAESGFQPLAVSRAGARGMWQFMASRASGYGLERNWWVDDRQDPVKSTRAAAEHLKDLYNQFGDWYLVMAAYNSGPLNVQQAVQRTGFADFWELYKRNVLPKETKNYVPIILAMTIMAKNPAQYGLTDVVPDSPLAFDTVTIDYPVDLRLVAECVDAPLETLQDLNPSLLRMTTPKQGTFDLNLPAGTKDKFQEAIAAIPANKRVWWRYHKVAPGETLASVAKQYRTTAKAITDVNGLSEDEVQTDTRLIIPIAPGRNADMEGMAFSRHPTRYRVRSGDTVLSVADDFSVPPERLRRWNHLKGNALRKGRMLVIYRPVPAGEETASVHHRSLRHTKSKSKHNKQLQASAELKKPSRKTKRSVHPSDEAVAESSAAEKSH